MKHLHRAPQAPRQGLSLVESMTALTVVSALVALALPSFRSAIERRHLEGMAQQFETDVHYARSLAVARNGSVRMSFSVGSDHSCYVIHSGEANACRCANDAEAVCTGSAQALRAVRVEGQTGVRMESNSSSMLFDATYGTITPTGTIQFVGSRGDRIHQIVNIMGRVRSCSPAPALSGYRAC